MNPTIVLAMLLTAVWSGCAPQAAVTPVPTAPERPAPSLASEQETAKSLILTLHMQGEKIEVESVVVVYGETRTYVADPDQFRVKLLGSGREVLRTIKTWDPRGLFILDEEPQPTADTTLIFPPRGRPRKLPREVVNIDVPKGKVGVPVGEAGTPEQEPFKERYVLLPEVKSDLVIPFLPNLKSVEFTDAKDRPYTHKKIDLVTLIRSFCLDHPDDQGCRLWLGSLNP